LGEKWRPTGADRSTASASGFSRFRGVEMDRRLSGSGGKMRFRGTHPVQRRVMIRGERITRPSRRCCEEYGGRREGARYSRHALRAGFRKFCGAWGGGDEGRFESGITLWVLAIRPLQGRGEGGRRVPRVSPGAIHFRPLRGRDKARGEWDAPRGTDHGDRVDHIDHDDWSVGGAIWRGMKGVVRNSADGAGR